MAAPTVPEHGVRVTFVLEREDGERAQYAAEVVLPGPRSVMVSAALERGESPTLADVGALPDWVVDVLGAIARTVSKNARWPRRVTRWRPEPQPRGGER